MIFEISRKIGTSKGKEKLLLDSTIKAGEYFKNLLSTKPIEEFTIALLNSQNRLIKTVTACKGTINEAPIYPREVVKTAILHNSSSVILAHNHPGESHTLSQSDIQATKKIKEALATVSIQVIDHIVVTGSSFISFAERGLI